MMSNRKTVLYVDDEEINLTLFKITFASDLDVMLAGSPKEALVKLEENKDAIHAVISDMNMPEMTGVEFVEKAHESNGNIPYFILSGYSFNDEIERAVKNNLVTKFFNKPFDKNEIKRYIG